MNPQSVAIAGSANPLKSRYESEIKQKYFQNPPICSPIYPPPPPQPGMQSATLNLIQITE